MWGPFLMKKLLKSEICESHEQCTRPTDVLKSQILQLLFMNSVWTVAVTVLFVLETHAKKKRSKTRKRDTEMCIQTDTMYPIPSFSLDPLPFSSPSPFIALVIALITTAVMLPTRVFGIFSLTLLISSPPLSWNSDFWELFVLFRLSYLYLMQQRLGKNPIINAEAKIFNFLACFRSFPWFQASPGNHTWTIHAASFR